MLPRLDVYWPAILEHPGTNLRALRVEHDGHRLSWPLLKRVSQILNTLRMCLVRAVGEVEPGNTHALVDEPDERVDVPA